MDLASKYSCEEGVGECANYTEFLASRRSTLSKSPVGAAAAKWLWDTWFGSLDGKDEHYVPEPQDSSNRMLGLGISYVIAPDKSKHVFAIARFSRQELPTYFEGRRYHNITNDEHEDHGEYIAGGKPSE